MTMMSPLVSVIIPVYNGEAFLAEAIKTVQAQNYPNLEILVVDDGSTDNTATIAQQFTDHIQYYYQANQGAAAARNLALKAAQGEVYAFLDVDDQWLPGAFELMLASLLSHPKVEIVRGLLQRQVIDGQTLPSHRLFSPTDWTTPCYLVNLGSALFRRSAFEKVGLFDSGLRHNEDFDWFLRAWERQIHKLDCEQLFLLYRFHAHNITHDLQQARLDRLTTFKKKLDRHKNRAIDTKYAGKSFPSFATYINGEIKVEIKCHVN
jgi:glycosyltransferase involved in cell wall biosynthesis